MSGVATAVVSNSESETLDAMLAAMGVTPNVRVSCEDVNDPKPSPEGYLMAMAAVGAGPSTTVAFEDAPVGKRAARASGARLVPVFSAGELTWEFAYGALAGWSSYDVVVPMAGEGDRFRQAGYELPKPLIDVGGEPMVRRAVESLGLPEADYVYLVRAQHVASYGVDRYLRLLTRSASVLRVAELTDGTARTCMLAEEFMDNDRPLVIMNSDQVIRWDADEALHRMVARNLDGLMLTFPCPTREPKWSYLETEPDGDRIVRVAEKDPVSDRAMVGVYIWRRGRDFVRSCRRMFADDRRVNGEFYVTPSVQYLLDEGMRFEAYDVEMHGLGTPEDLQRYLNGGDE
jgi:dTDP-glucose pyrophosphorylase